MFIVRATYRYCRSHLASPNNDPVALMGQCVKIVNSVADLDPAESEPFLVGSGSDQIVRIRPKNVIKQEINLIS